MLAQQEKVVVYTTVIMQVGVFALIKNEEGKILLVKDVTRQQLWTLPGGGPDFQRITRGRPSAKSGPAVM